MKKLKPGKLYRYQEQLIRNYKLNNHSPHYWVFGQVYYTGIDYKQSIESFQMDHPFLFLGFKPCRVGQHKVILKVLTTTGTLGEIELTNPNDCMYFEEANDC